MCAIYSPGQGLLVHRLGQLPPLPRSGLAAARPQLASAHVRAYFCPGQAGQCLGQAQCQSIHLSGHQQAHIAGDRKWRGCSSAAAWSLYLLSPSSHSAALGILPGSSTISTMPVFSLTGISPPTLIAANFLAPQ